MSRFVFGFVTSYRDPDLDFAKQSLGSKQGIFSCMCASQMPEGFTRSVSKEETRMMHERGTPQWVPLTFGRPSAVVVTARHPKLVDP